MLASEDLTNGQAPKERTWLCMGLATVLVSVALCSGAECQTLPGRAGTGNVRPVPPVIRTPPIDTSKVRKQLAGCYIEICRPEYVRGPDGSRKRQTVCSKIFMTYAEMAARHTSTSRCVPN